MYSQFTLIKSTGNYRFFYAFYDSSVNNGGIYCIIYIYGGTLY